MTGIADRRRRDLLALAGLAIVGLGGCLTDGGDPVESAEPAESRVLAADVDREDPTVAPAELDEVVDAIASFGVALLQELDGEENLFVSPISISLALAMTWAGAEGDTEAAMADALRFPHDQEMLHRTYNALSRALDTDADGGGSDVGDSDGADAGGGGGGSDAGDGRGETDASDGDDEDAFTLRIANAIWGQDEYPFSDDFLETLARNYGAGLRVLDFATEPESARGAINDWVASATEEKIEELLPEGSITPHTRLVLTNAIYFLATWRHQFDEANTTSEPFTALDGSVSEVPTMHQHLRTRYGEVDGHQVLELPYDGGDVSFVLLLPAEGEFESFRDSLDADRLDELFASSGDASGDLALPRFAFESSFSLEDTLSALGMGVAFDEVRANFDGMTDTDERLFVDDVYHDAYVSVDEEGTEAAAATGVVVMPTSAPPRTFEVVVDRPFVFAIRDDETGCPLFLGQVVDAAAAQ